MPPKVVKEKRSVRSTAKKATVQVVQPVVAKSSSLVVKKMPVRDLVVPVLVGAIIVASFAVGYLYGKVSVYEKLGTNPAAAGGQQAAQPAQPDQKAVTVSVDRIRELMKDSTNIVFGDPNKKLLFVEFSDPSCPYCHVAGGHNSELNKQMGNQFLLKADGGTYVAPIPEIKKLVDAGKAALLWVYSPGHGNGEVGTQALYCAKEQGKFWEAHDLLMSNKGYTLLNDTVQNDVKKSNLVADLLKGVLNGPALQTCITSGKYAARITSDPAIAQEFGVQGTPSFFVNDKNFAGAYSFTDMQSAVDLAQK